MNKLKLLRILAEQMATSFDAYPSAHKAFVEQFFQGLVKEMYPSNLHRRKWAQANLQLFYEQERERITIMNKLTGKTTGQGIIDRIRKRREG